VVEDISHEGLRELLAAEGVSCQAVKTWKQSSDPDYAAWPVPAGAFPLTAVAGLEAHASVLELLLPVLEQPAAASPAATATAAPAIADRRGLIVLAYYSWR